MKKTILILFVLSAFWLSLNAQTTVITHGYAALTSDPINGWMLDMANGICNRAGSGVVRIYNKTTGNFDYKSGSGNRTVLLFDWWDDSNDLHKGFSEGAGAALFAALMNGYINNDFNLNELHFIGHSRGCIVNSEAIERLLVAGFPVEQQTSIDAHDWGGLGITITDYDANPDSINSGVEGWAGIAWADSYWQDALFSTNGRAVEGTYSEYKGTITHDGIHDWYLETILDTTLHEGYYYSRLGGGSSTRPPRTGYQRNPFFTFSNDGIINGNFERGGAIYQKITGWWYHGGGGDADIDDTYLVLHSGGSQKKHDRFYIPPNASSIKFMYKINEKDNSGAIPNIDQMRIKMNDTILLDNVWMDTEMQDWSVMTIDISNMQNSVKTLTFELIDEFGGTNELNSEIWLDNIHFDLQNTTNVIDYKKNNFCQIYPNPVCDKINVQINKSSQSNGVLHVYNVVGKLVYSVGIFSGLQSINIEQLENGIYIFEIEYDGLKDIHKIIIQR